MEKVSKAVGYCRFSSTKQREESIEAQQEAILRFAKENDYIITKWYIDRAVSGKTDTREHFQQMITDSYNREFRFVIVHKRDRFSRDEYDPAIYKKKLRDNKVKVLYAGEPNLTGVAGIYLDKVYEANAAGYSINLVSEVRKGMRMNAKKAQVNSKPPYGYKLVAKKDKYGEVIVSPSGRVAHDMVIDPFRAEAVKLMFNMTLAGRPLSEIIEELNAKGFKNSNGESFWTNSLGHYLRNERYTGTYIYDPSKKYKAEECIEEDELSEDSEHRIIRVEDGLPQIISYEVFNAVQKILDSRKHRRSSKSKVDYLLTGKIVCGECGKEFTGSTHYKNGQPYHYYRCGRANAECKVVSVRKEPLEDFVIKEMEKVVHSEEFIVNILDRFVTFYKETNSKNEIIGNLDKERKAIEKKISNLVDIIAESGNLSEIFQSKLDSLTSEQAEILTKIKKESSFNLEEFVTKEQIRRSYFRVLALLKSGNVEDKAAIINTLLNRVIVYKDRVEIFINILPLENSNVDLQITDKDLATYGLIEPSQKEKIAQMDDFSSENLFGDPSAIRTRDTMIKSHVLCQLS